MFDVRRFEFRDIRGEEAQEAARIEQICFPPNEACRPERIAERTQLAADTFLVAYDRVNRRIAGFINGLSTHETVFRDEFFTDISLNDPAGKTIMILGVDVLPEYRHRGLATVMMERYVEREEKKGREQLLLTCLPGLVEFYRNMGYEDLGFGNSEWGGEKWHDMVYQI